MLITPNKLLLSYIKTAKDSHDGLAIKFSEIILSATKSKNINEIRLDTGWPTKVIGLVLNEYKKRGHKVLIPRPKEKKPFVKNKIITTFEGAEWSYYKGALLISSMQNTNSIINTINALVPNLKNKDILDVGSGEGAQAMMLTDMGGCVQCVDMNGLRHVPKNVPFLELNINDGLIDKFPVKKFDLIVCIEVLAYLKEPSIFLNEAFQLLKHGGHLVISMNNITNFVSRSYFMTEGTFYNVPKKKLLNGAPSPLATLPWFAYEQMFKISGFTNVHTQETDPMSIISVQTVKSTVHSILRIFAYILSLKSYNDPRTGRQILITGVKK